MNVRRTLRAKVRVESVRNYGTQIEVTARPVMSCGREHATPEEADRCENHSYSKYTPDGLLQLKIDNPRAMDFFVPGREYYLDISPPPEPPPAPAVTVALTYGRYHRGQSAEMADWAPGMDMAGVSVSEADRAAGSPKPGDMIARNPANHADRWLVSAEYFDTNFEECEQ